MQPGQYTGSCCLNGSFYRCDDEPAFRKCAGFNTLACLDGCGFSDTACRDRCFDMGAMATRDPSSCQRDASQDGTCGAATSPTAPGGDTCNNLRGAACSYSHQCSSNNCTDGYCRGKNVGDACSYSHQCNSNNCTDGCCRANSKGSKCGYSHQCTSNNCAGGRCQ